MSVSLALPHHCPDCRCRVFDVLVLTVEHVTYTVDIPCCRSRLSDRLAPLLLVSRESGYRLLTRIEAARTLQAHGLPLRLLGRVPHAGTWGFYSLRDLARVTRGRARSRCGWCRRRFNLLHPGPGRPVPLYRLQGVHTVEETEKACSARCALQLVHQNQEVLKCLRRELAVTRAIKTQLRELRALTRQMEQEEERARGPIRRTPDPSTSASPRPASAPATTSAAS